MAAKRITQSAINWASIAERVPETQKHIYLQFKAKSDNYLRKMLAYPENPPEIDWASYSARIPVKGMVDDFKKKYQALQIPYPPDTLSSKLDSVEKDVKADIVKYKEESNIRIEEHKKQLAYLASLIPFDQMTMENFKDSFPEFALDQNKPTFWPHEGDGPDRVPDASSSH
ncbi:hypothetical protein FQA39_LY07559 [Lamprigera yunnana]|nr:hypothetical protein FQA39_LY07559 [Lamprigera yunnana]